MLSDLNARLAILSLFLTNSIALASVLNGTKETEGLVERIVEVLQVPWINGFKSILNHEESTSCCRKETEGLLAAIDTGETWALKMLDASSQIDSGIFGGRTSDFGMFDQCLGIQVYHDDVKIRGKHCTIATQFKTLKLVTSVCLPSSCNETQAIKIAKFVFENAFANSSVNRKITNVVASCARIDPEEFTVGEMVTITVFSFVGVFMSTCTLCDIVVVGKNLPNGNPGLWIKILAKFSLYKNALQLFSTELRPGMMPSINGIRFFSTCWIAALHNYESRLVQMWMNFSRVTDTDSPDTPHPLWHEFATFATDNFFLISGFLPSYLFFKKIRSVKKFNLPMMYLHRYIRLTPCVAVVMIFMTVFYHRMGNGPLWDGTSPSMYLNCCKNWWYNILYIQNFIPSTELCMMSSWFLAADMQLFLLSPIILYPLYRWPKFGMAIWIIFLISSIVTPTLIVGLNGYNIIGNPSIESFENYYIRPYTRAFPYLLGIYLGFEIVMKKKKQLAQITVAIGWILACVFFVFCCLMMHELKKKGIEYNPTFQIFSAALVRPLWSIAMAWVIYACTQGYGGIIADFLSLPIFLPLAKLCYGVYLVHMIIMVARGLRSRVFDYDIESHLPYYYVGDLLISIAVSAVISLFFEMPIMVLEKILTNGCQKREHFTPEQQVAEEEFHTGMNNRPKTETQNSLEVPESSNYRI